MAERQVRIVGILEGLISDYAKRIYGFAYSKTHNFHEAQDLSQEILLTLCSIDFSSKNISNMDAYIYRICYYTWSNFARKNKFVWESVAYDDFLQDVACQDTPEDIVIQSELYQKLRREIMYLGKIKREVTILFYYENKSGREIAELLGIPASTVRWHLGESRKQLKERMEMKNEIYTPEKLSVYFCGNANDCSLAGLRDDLLVQNICIVCAKEALTVEEIASRLCVSAAFFEDRLEKLVFMNYLEQVGKSKYRTTFLIRDADFIIAQKRYELEYFPLLADALGRAVISALPKIRDIGFIGCDLEDNFLLWAFASAVAHRYFAENEIASAKRPPIRGDGSTHWIMASSTDDAIQKRCDTLPAELCDYIRGSGGAAGKHMGNGKTCAQQFDPAIVGDRAAFFDTLFQSYFKCVFSIVKEDRSPNEQEKEMIAYLASCGYVKAVNGKPKIMIPYFKSEEYDRFMEIVDDVILPSIKQTVGKDFPVRYSEYIATLIPSWLSEEEKTFVKTRFYEPNAITYLLYSAGVLKEPTDEQKKRLCTIIFEQ